MIVVVVDFDSVATPSAGPMHALGWSRLSHSDYIYKYSVCTFDVQRYIASRKSRHVCTNIY